MAEKTMNISVILGHPTPGSFNHAIAETATRTLGGLGHAVAFHDLYGEQFDPIMRTPEIPKGSPVPPLVERHCGEIADANGIIIIHPNWWCQPPAILKGWVDRVLRPGQAYNFVNGKGVGLLKAKAALVITTANNPQENEENFYGDPLETFWKKVVFGLCGVPCQRLIFAPVILSTLPQRQQWLRDVETGVKGTFGE